MCILPHTCLKDYNLIIWVTAFTGDYILIKISKSRFRQNRHFTFERLIHIPLFSGRYHIRNFF
jgi:hypothetical protein